MMGKREAARPPLNPQKQQVKEVQMEKLRRAGKTALVGIYAVMTLFMLFSMNNTANSATRQENVQEIERVLNNELVKSALKEKGASYEKVMGNLATLSDDQIEKLAEQTVQLGGAIESSEKSEAWTLFGLSGIYLLILVLLPIILIGALA